MIGIAVLLVVIITMLVNILVRLQRLEGQAEFERVQHARCLAHIAHYTGNEFAALVLRAAAEDYDRPKTQNEIQIISREQWVEGGPRIPSIWMSNRADALQAEVQP